MMLNVVNANKRKIVIPADTKKLIKTIFNNRKLKLKKAADLIETCVYKKVYSLFSY